MSSFKDSLGGFIIPPHLLEAAAKYATENPTTAGGIFDTRITSTDDWSTVKVIKSSSSDATHRVLRKGNELRCTCQGFKIGKKGFCKHTKLVAKELGL